MRGHLYRLVMRLAHRFNWHYMPPVYPDGDTMLWCKWCGVRDVIARRNHMAEGMQIALAAKQKAQANSGRKK